MNNENEINILLATENDDYSLVDQLLKEGVSANTCNDFGLTALHIAASRGNLKIIDLLISSNANINVKCIDGWTPLCEAVKYNQLNVFDILLRHGAEPNQPKKWTLYEVALRSSANIKFFEVLLPILIKIELHDNEITKIFKKAIQKGRYDVLDVIISLRPNFSTYLDSHPTSKRIVTLEMDVLFDTHESELPLNATLVEGCCDLNFIEIYCSGVLLYQCSSEQQLFDAGYYPRLAKFHPKLEITGLSHEYGGWIGTKAYRYLDACPSYKWLFVENSLNILPCLDSDMLANLRKQELNIDRIDAITLGKSAVQICEQGYYVSHSGSTINIANKIEIAVKQKISIHPDDELPVLHNFKSYPKTNVQITNETTLSASRRMILAGLNPLALNFANGVYPGGGFLRGARAQEETLCRSSSLYMTLVNDPMYEFHRTRPLPDSSSWAILSPKVPVFRQDNGELLDDPWLLSFITCAAPYAPRIGVKESNDLLCERIFRVMTIAQAYGYTSLVLGAWGCGAFGNEPFNIARYFKEVLVEDFRGKFSDVTFAITDWSDDRKFIKPFQNCFHN